MEVRAVIYHSEDVSEELYLDALNRVPPESQTRIKKFYRRDDAVRTLIGELLVRLLLHEQDRAQPPVLAKTAEGKPYILNQDPDLPIGFNITHDNALIAVASSQGTHNPPAFTIGIDVMKTHILGRGGFASFIETFEEQLTNLEVELLTDDTPERERLRRFFWMWTLKEAYTKALGLGLGFDFKRIEFNVAEKQVKIDGKFPKGWRFTMFTVPDGGALYEGVVAEFVGGELIEILDECNHTDLPWLQIDRASSILQKAIEKLPSV